MTDGQRLRLVELPLALPVILAGVRIAAVVSVGTATIAAAVGAGGLGHVRLPRHRHRGHPPHPGRRDPGGAAGPGRRRPARARSSAAARPARAAAVAGRLRRGLPAGRWPAPSAPSPGGRRVVVGSKNFTEQVLLGEILAAALEDRGFPVDRRLNLGRHHAVPRGRALRPASTSTSNTPAPRSPTILGRPARSDRDGVLRDVRAGYARARARPWPRPSGSTTPSRWSCGPRRHGAWASGASPTWPRTRTPCASASSASSSSAPTGCPASWPRTASAWPCRPRRWTSVSSTRRWQADRVDVVVGSATDGLIAAQRPRRARGRPPLLPALRRRARREHGQPGPPSGDRSRAGRAGRPHRRNGHAPPEPGRRRRASLAGGRGPRVPAGVRALRALSRAGVSSRRPCAQDQRLRRSAGLMEESMLRALVLGVVLVAVPGPAARAADAVALSIDASKPGAKIDRNIFGQFAEHLGTGIYEGVWVGPDSPIPNTRGIRNDVVAALKALKVPNVRWPGGCFADEYHWRKGIGKSPPGDPQSQLGRRHRAEHLRHARVHGLHRPDRQRGLPLGQHRLGHPAGSRGMAGVPDHRPADGAGQGARRQRPSRAVQDPLPRPRQRELGLRRQHDRRSTTRGR